MSVYVVEQLNSRSVSRTQGKLKGTRTFHVWDDGTPLTTPNSISALFGSNGLPYFGEPFPGTTSLGAIDWSIASVEGHRDLWLVTWEYQEVSGGGVIVQPPPPGPDEVVDASVPGYIEVNATLSASHVDIWRAIDRATIIANCSASGVHALGLPGQVDIGGLRVDAGGNPVSYILRQFEINITLVREGRFRPLNLLSFVWKRNSTSFLDCQPGSVIYCGASVNRIGERKFQYNHKFIYDQWFHMRQSAMCDMNGDVLLGPRPGSPGMSAAEDVRFVQPFPDLTEFRNIDALFLKVT